MVCVMQHASRASPKHPAMAYLTIRSAATAAAVDISAARRSGAKNQKIGTQ
jgi:hypothetical protein